MLVKLLDWNVEWATPKMAGAGCVSLQSAQGWIRIRKVTSTGVSHQGD